MLQILDTYGAYVEHGECDDIYVKHQKHHVVRGWNMYCDHVLLIALNLGFFEGYPPVN